MADEENCLHAVFLGNYFWWISRCMHETARPGAPARSPVFDFGGNLRSTRVIAWTCKQIKNINFWKLPSLNSTSYLHKSKLKNNTAKIKEIQRRYRNKVTKTKTIEVVGAELIMCNNIQLLRQFWITHLLTTIFIALQEPKTTKKKPSNS